MANGLPEIRPGAVTTPPSGVSDGGNRAIASAFGDISRGAASIAQNLRAREASEGSESALEAFNRAAASTPAGEVVAVPEREGGLLDRLGVADEAYANTVRALTLQRAEKDANDVLRQLRVDTFGKPGEFDEKASQFISGYLGKAPAESVAQIELIMRGKAASLHSDALIERRKLDMDEDRQATNAQIASREENIRDLADRFGLAAFQREDFQRSVVEIEQLLDRKADDPTHVYSQEQRDHDYGKFLEGLQFTAASATIKDEIRDALDFSGLSGAKSSLDEILSSDTVQSFDRKTQEQLRLSGERLIEERERDIKEAIGEAKKRRNEVQSAQYMEFALRIADGNAPTRAELQEAYDSGGLDSGHLLALVQQTGKRDDKTNKLQEAYDRVSSTRPLNPADAKDRNAIDMVFDDAGGARLMQEDFEQGMDLALSFAKTKGVFPASAASSLKALVAGGGTEQMGFALDAIARSYEEAPGAAGQAFNNAELQEAIYFRDMTANGAAQELTVGAIIEQRKAKFDPALKDRLKEGRSVAVDEIDLRATNRVIGADADGESGPLDFLDAPDLAGGQPALEAANRMHRELFAANYQSHGNANMAKKQADAILKKTFGKSTATGAARIMQYPPEHYYSVPGVKNKWMGEQFKEVTTSIGDGKFELVSDVQTAAEVQSGSLPSYKIIRIRPDGVFEAVDGRFVFDPAEALAEAKGDIEDELASARILRAGRGDNAPRDLEFLKSVR